MADKTLKFREQHKQRLGYMPWLYWALKPAHKEWALAWQKEWQQYLQEMETIEIGDDCFISPDAKLFAEPGRPIQIAEHSFIGSNSVLHGPIHIGEHVGINHHVTMDGGRAGIRIGNHSRIAAHCSLFAFNHRYDADRHISDQGHSSKGIELGQDVWLGTHTGITDGVSIGDGSVVGMHSVVTHNVGRYEVVAGNPARKIKERT